MKAWRWCRCEVVERRARFNLAKAEKRLHLVQGFLTALTDLDQVVKLIRAADDGQHKFPLFFFRVAYLLKFSLIMCCMLPQSCLSIQEFTSHLLHVASN